VVLGVNTADDEKICTDFLAQKQITFTNVLDSSMEANMAMMRYETLGMSAVPMTYLVDREGKIVDAWYGYDKGQAEAGLKKLGF